MLIRKGCETKPIPFELFSTYAKIFYIFFLFCCRISIIGMNTYLITSDSIYFLIKNFITSNLKNFNYISNNIILVIHRESFHVKVTNKENTYAIL